MSFLKGRVAVLATMHGKEEVIAPILEKEFGLKVVVPQDFDSDKFGTFTMDIARTGNQLEAARRKVRAAMMLTGLDLGIASEGSFGLDPQIPLIQSNLELVVLIDDKNSLEIRGHHRSFDTNISGEYVTDIKEALKFSKRIGFPNHAVVIREDEKSKYPIFKGIKTEEELYERVQNLLQTKKNKRIYIETDMRAHMNPTRMDKIMRATEDLVSNIKSECPECGAPGFSIIDFKTGLKCSACGLPTDSPVAYVRRCQKCNLENDCEISTKPFEDPVNCSRCNP